VGAVFPDYELTDHNGQNRRSLSETAGARSHDPGGSAVEDNLPEGSAPKPRGPSPNFTHEMEVGYSRLATISTDKHAYDE